MAYFGSICINSVIYFLFVSIFRITNGGAWATYVGITDQTKEYYENNNISSILWLANVFLLVFLFFSFLGSWFVYKYFTISMISAAFFGCVGAWMRYLVGKNLTLAIISQLIIAISQIFILETPAFLTERFFHYKERLIALSIGVFSNYLGIGLGYMFSPLLVGDNSNNVEKLLFIEAIILTVPFVLIILVIKEKPDYPPNYSSTLHKFDFKTSFKQLCKNKNFIIAMLAFSFFLGNSWTLTTILDSFLDKSLISQNNVGYLGLSFILSGMLSGFMASIFLEFKTNSYKYVDTIIKCLAIFSTLFLFILSVQVLYEEIISIFFIVCMLGFGIVGLTPFACVVLVEVTFPVPESISINVYYFFSSILSFASSNIATIDVFKKYGLLVLPILQILPLIYILFFYQTNFKKTKKEGKYSSFNSCVG